MHQALLSNVASASARASYTVLSVEREMSGRVVKFDKVVVDGSREAEICCDNTEAQLGPGCSQSDHSI